MSVHWPLGDILLAIEGEDVFLVSSDQQDWRSQITRQEVQPCQVESAGTDTSPPHRHGAVTGKKVLNR